MRRFLSSTSHLELLSYISQYVSSSCRRTQWDVRFSMNVLQQMLIGEVPQQISTCQPASERDLLIPSPPQEQEAKFQHLSTTGTSHGAIEWRLGTVTFEPCCVTDDPLHQCAVIRRCGLVVRRATCVLVPATVSDSFRPLQGFGAMVVVRCAP